MSEWDNCIMDLIEKQIFTLTRLFAISWRSILRLAIVALKISMNWTKEYVVIPVCIFLMSTSWMVIEKIFIFIWKMYSYVLKAFFFVIQKISKMFKFIYQKLFDVCSKRHPQLKKNWKDFFCQWIYNNTFTVVFLTSTHLNLTWKSIIVLDLLVI